MAGAVKNIVDLAVFHGTAGVHHQNLVANTGHHAQIVGNHDDGGAEIAFQLVEQRHDLRLYGYIERGGRFVGNQKFGAAQQGHRNHHPLAHAAGEFVRIHADAFFCFGNFHRIQHLHRFIPSFAFAHALVPHQHFGQLLAHLHIRIE